MPPAPATSVVTKIEPPPESTFAGGEPVDLSPEQPVSSLFTEPTEPPWPEPEPVLTFNYESGHEGVIVEPPETPRVRWDRDPTQPNGLRASCTVDFTVDPEPADSPLAQADLLLGPEGGEPGQPLDDLLAQRPWPFTRDPTRPRDPLAPRDPIAPPSDPLAPLPDPFAPPSPEKLP